MIEIKTDADLELMRSGGLILARVIQGIVKYAREGVTTEKINLAAEELIDKEGAVPAFKGYKGYPATICASVNEEIVHGIPADRVLRSGDIVSLDIGIRYKGFYSDMAVTLPIGDVSARVKRLIEVTRKSLQEGIKKACENNHLFDISHAIQRCVEDQGFSIVRQFVGHGIGKSLHEEPEIPNFGQAAHGPVLKRGMVLAIEPMVNMGTWESEILDNGWTAVTKDKLCSAHFEHTVAITAKGPEVLTRFA